MFKFIFKKVKNTKAFTLVELIVVLAIMLIIGTIIFVNYDSYRSSVTVNSVAQEVALTVRKAQSYALGLQAPGILATLPVRGYGVRFDVGIKDQITFFSEILPVDNQYTQSSSNCGSPAVGNECLEYYNIQTGDLIDKILINGQDISQYPSSSVDVIFKKPAGDVVFCLHLSGSVCSSSSTTAVSLMTVVLVSETGVRKNVNIYGNGQISVD